MLIVKGELTEFKGAAQRRRIDLVSIKSIPFSRAHLIFAISVDAYGNVCKQTGGSGCESNRHTNVNTTTCSATDDTLRPRKTALGKQTERRWSAELNGASGILKWDDPVIALSKLDSDIFRVKVRANGN
jgi:hypothetical protein